LQNIFRKKTACHLQNQKSAGAKILLSSIKIKITGSPQIDLTAIAPVTQNQATKHSQPHNQTTRIHVNYVEKNSQGRYALPDQRFSISHHIADSCIDSSGIHAL